MRKAVLVITISLATLNFGFSLYKVSGMSSNSFPPPVMQLA
ncbi:hypothetical protein [Francisella orientalis]|uniref:Uncharacterized protein n=1 Tax=Francisella orientalis TaxID=299583 RepID=A0ABM5U552_9GAMM|nr:hypothetical protein [Francisella orientalis]AFJ42589.1 hypothetical protein OOM_0014 [Francisella orientalis str. Toba 04]AHB97752.1 hypothetical protein M973_00450 [Francisella orientalis LADL 07-285A]AKN84840.1 hypothetical protein FNO12_0015 [Francisella orientalis FNO12]AKN86378.1 Hypothetical protein FNO24_0015 [Francisella orientalis FNO24]AKN87916.1 Hypothetical protein FNO190_0015 [Francisella orientalis]